MDSIIEYNRKQWNALADAGVMHSVPWLDCTPELAAEYVYRHDFITDVRGKNVLLLAQGGGKGSVAFGLLGANVTVTDLSDVQLDRDREAAAHHGLDIRIIQGDMRDLSDFSDNEFDLVWQPYSVNYSPSVEPVFAEVARVLKSGCVYNVTFANPMAQALDGDWDGKGYHLQGLYTDGEDISHYYPQWDAEQADGSVVKVPSPHEFRHSMSTVLNSLASNGFILLHLEEWMRHNENPEPGSWPHFTQCAPPWFDSFWRLSK